MNFTWEGRQLKTAVANGKNINYTYKSDGIRTGKTVDGVATKYFLDGSTILAQQTGSDVLWFLYESDGTRVGFTYNGTSYYYTKNAQGDVTGIVDSNYNTVVEYTYDAWGKLLSTTGTLASTIGKVNPFLYRGYYFDTETGLYYLNSRYYDSQTGRFVSEDGQLNPDTGMTGNNLFSYCNNNSVNMSDYSGARFTEYDDGSGRWYNVGSGGKVFQGYVASTKIDVNNDSDYDDNYNKPKDDKLRSKDAKNRERKQIDDAFGKDRSKREKQSKDLHDSKEGKRNDKNSSFGDLKSGNYWIEPLKGGGMVVAGAIGYALLAADDVTGWGVADDIFMPGPAAMIGEGIILIFG